MIKYQKNIASKETVKKYFRHSGREEARNSRGKLIFKRLDGVDIVRNDLIGGTSHQSAGLSCLLVAKHERLHFAEVLPSWSEFRSERGQQWTRCHSEV